MNKYLQSFYILIIVFLFEATPFLYNDTYEWGDLKWGWIIGLPIVWFIRNLYGERRVSR
jgi:hypothetical protein